MTRQWGARAAQAGILSAGILLAGLLLLGGLAGLPVWAEQGAAAAGVPAAGVPAEGVREERWVEESAVALQPDLHHVQGIDIEGDVLWVSSVERKTKKGFVSRLSRRTGALLAQVEVQAGEMFHPGGLALDGEAVWVPVAEYDRDGPTQVQRRDKRTLRLLDSFVVADHIGCVAVRKNQVVGGSWSSRTIYAWDRKGALAWKKANPVATHWQDLKFDGELLVGGGIVPGTVGDVPGAGGDAAMGAVEWVQLPELRVVRRIVVGETARKITYGHEGMAWKRGELYLLPEDYPTKLYRMKKQ